MNADPESFKTAVEIGSAAWLVEKSGGRDLIVKLLGPTIDYYGSGLRLLNEKAARNIQRIFVRAAQMLGPKLEDPGIVPPRLLLEISQQGAFTEDAITTEYLAGVLASSRTDAGVDDRGIPHARQIARLSHYQLNLHYVIYHSIRARFVGSGIDAGSDARGELYSVFALSEAFQVCSEQGDRGLALILHAAAGLAREGLIEQWKICSGIHVKDLTTELAEACMSVGPTIAGIELFFWGHGKPDIHVGKFLDLAIEIAPLPGIPVARWYRPN